MILHPDKVNEKIEESVGAEEINEEASENPENIDAESSVHPEACVDVARYDKINHRKPVYLRTMVIDVETFDR